MGGSASKSSPGSAVTAKLFTNGRSQAVRLPKEFRFEGDAVSIRRVEKGILLEPIKKPMTREQVKAFFARLDSYGADPLLPEGRNQGVVEPENFFD